MKRIILSKCFLHGVLLTLAFCLFPVLPAFAQEDIVDRLDKALGVTLPSEYKGKVKAFVQGSKVLEGIGAIPTEQFIKEQMKENWGINKQNQLLFIWDAIYEQITKKNFYDGEDGNKQRLDDFENALDKIEACGKKYKQDYKAYMEQQSAEARQQSAEADRQIAEADRQIAEADRQIAEARQQSAEADRQIAEARQQSAEADRQIAEAIKEIMKQDSVWVKERMVEFYNLYLQNPNIIKKEDLNFMKESTKGFIEDCKKQNIDYKAILRKELGDEQKVKDLLKFYGAE